MTQWAKNLPVMQETEEMWVQSLGREDALVEKMATHPSILAWKIPWTEEPGRLQFRDCRVRHLWVFKHRFKSVLKNYIWHNSMSSLRIICDIIVILWQNMHQVHFISEKAMAPHSSTLAWKIPWTAAYQAAVHGVAKSQTRLRDFTSTFHFHALEKEMATYSSVLA